MLLNEFVSVIGLVSGVAGFVLGVLNYSRDRCKIVVTLKWDMEAYPSSESKDEKRFGIIVVTNIGRRAAYISHAAIRLPEEYENKYLIIKGGIEGKKIAEGDPPVIYTVTQEGMEQYASHWREVVAQVNDSTGKEWVSKKLKPTELPSWAKKQ